jgi:neutral ceramidase
MLRAGAASRDITPELRGDFFGYVRPDLRARGVALRLFAHALVLDDGERRIGVVTADLGAPLVTDAVLERLAPHGFDATNLIVAATHTHAGPNRPGSFVADQVADAVLAADAALRPARAVWSDASVPDANHNRSLEAHLANHGLDLYPGTGAPELDPHGEDHPRDTTVRLLKVEGADGTPLAAWAQFSAHPTTFGPANRYFSADYPRTAIHHFRAGFTSSPPVAIVTNGTEGDLIPRYDEVSQHALADRIGRRVAAAMRRAWDGADHPSADLSLDGAGRRIVYAGQEVAPGRRVGSRAWFGLPFLGGAENGPSFLYGLGLEGKRRPRWLAGRVHGRKLVAAPAPHGTDAEVTVLRVGERLLLSVPGEPSVEAGRRMCAAALEAAPPGVRDALIVGLAHRYRGYFTTPEEYDQQHYEGGHTVFGRHTSLLIEATHTELAARLAVPPPAALVRTTPAAPPPDVPTGGAAPGVSTGGAALPGSSPATSSGGSTGSGAPVTALPGAMAARRTRITGQPPTRVARSETFEVTWRTAPRGRDRPVDAPLLVLQRASDGTWVDVDDDLGLGFVWWQRGRRATARYEIAADAPTGRYRIEVRGGREAVATDEFEVAAHDRLRIRGVEAHDGTLRFLAQTPAPDPHRHLRARDRTARGGTLRFVAVGREHEARWDEEAGGWLATLDTLPDEVHVPAGGLRDGDGNRSGGVVDLTVGEVAPVVWPPAIGPGGGRSPGPFGLGAAGKPPPWPPSEAARG